MTEKELKDYVLNLFRYKSITSRQLATAKSSLEQLKEIDSLFYYFNRGRLHVNFDDVDEAIEFLTKSVELKNDHSSTYYNLYKCFVKKGDVDTAFAYLSECLKHNKNEVDFNFQFQIMRAIDSLNHDYLSYLDLDLSVDEGNKIGYNDLSDNEQLATAYSEVIKAFNDRNYVECLKQLRVMDSVIINTDYPMEVDTLISLVRILKDKEISCCKQALRDNGFENASDENFCKFQLRLLELGHYSEESFLRMTDELIGKGDIFKAEILLNGISHDSKFEQYLDIVEYLKGFIREKRAFMFLPKEAQEEFNSRKLNARRLYRNKNNDEAFKEYSALKDEFGLPICDYYIGKILFRQGKFLEAKEAFLKYLEQGGTKAEKVYSFLGKIEKANKNKNGTHKWVNMIHKIQRVLIHDYGYILENNYKKLGLNGDKYDQNDVLKIKKSRSIKMTEDDFTLQDYSSADQFYDVDVDGKLSIIRGLYRNGYTEVANKLFEEVQRECTSEERGKVMQFERNRKIYKNQNRAEG